jgi:two-component system cell cycle response regulator CtrA
MDLQARLDLVTAELATARERIAQLEDMLCVEAPWTGLLGLTRAEGVVLTVLMRRDIVSKSQVMAALYAGRADGGEEIGQKITDVFICKLRRKLKEYGIGIDTVWGIGWRMKAADKAAVTALAQQVRAA